MSATQIQHCFQAMSFVFSLAVCEADWTETSIKIIGAYYPDDVLIRHQFTQIDIFEAKRYTSAFMSALCYNIKK